MQNPSPSRSRHRDRHGFIEVGSCTSDLPYKGLIGSFTLHRRYKTLSAIPPLQPSDTCSKYPKMKPRKTHLKSRTGCTTCRARRIKCDESKPQWYVSSNDNPDPFAMLSRTHSINCTRRQVRCDFLGTTTSSKTFPEESLPQMARILHALSDSDADGIAEPEPESLLRLFPTDCPDFSKQERFLTAHFCKISEGLVTAGIESLDFGFSLLPEFVIPPFRRKTLL